MLAKHLFRNAKRRVILALAGLCLATGLPGAAQAATYLLTFTGIVSTSGAFTDGAGIFGQAGADLAGLGYTQVFTINIPTPGAGIYTGFDGLPAGIEGNYEASPVIGSLTVNAITYAFPQVVTGNYARHVEGAPFGDFRYDVLRGRVGGQGNNALFGGLFAETGGPGSFFQSGDFVKPLDFDIANGQSGNGFFAFFGANGLGSGPTTNLSLEASHVTFAAQAVPEPATWAMFIGGFGLVGGTLRRRQRVPAGAAAG